MKVSFRYALLSFALALAAWLAMPQAGSAQILALGASNVQGYGVSASEAFPAQLQAMLHARGKAYTVTSSGIFGDTTAGILARLDSAVPAGTKIVLLLIGGNDVRRGASPAQARAGFREIVARLSARGIRVINVGPYFHQAQNAGLMQPDGIHLSPAGHHLVAERLAAAIR